MNSRKVPLRFLWIWLCVLSFFSNPAQHGVLDSNKKQQTHSFQPQAPISSRHQIEFDWMKWCVPFWYIVRQSVPISHNWWHLCRVRLTKNATSLTRKFTTLKSLQLVLVDHMDLLQKAQYAAIKRLEELALISETLKDHTVAQVHR